MISTDIGRCFAFPCFPIYCSDVIGLNLMWLSVLIVTLTLISKFFLASIISTDYIFFFFKFMADYVIIFFISITSADYIFFYFNFCYFSRLYFCFVSITLAANRIICLISITSADYIHFFYFCNFSRLHFFFYFFNLGRLYNSLYQRVYIVFDYVSNK